MIVDKQDFEVTVDETFDEIERRLDELAVNGVEVTIADGVCTLVFEDVSRIVFKRDTPERRIQMEFHAGEVSRFYYDNVEEDWFNEETEEPLMAAVGRIVGWKTGRPVDLSEV